MLGAASRGLIRKPREQDVGERETFGGRQNFRKRERSTVNVRTTAHYISPETILWNTVVLRIQKRTVDTITRANAAKKVQEFMKPRKKTLGHESIRVLKDENFGQRRDDELHSCIKELATRIHRATTLAIGAPRLTGRSTDVEVDVLLDWWTVQDIVIKSLTLVIVSNKLPRRKVCVRGANMLDKKMRRKDAESKDRHVNAREVRGNTKSDQRT